MQYWNKIKVYYEQNPLLFIVLVGAFFRLVASIFSMGYGMMDDHFVVMEKIFFLQNDIPDDFWTPIYDGGNGASKRCLLYTTGLYGLVQFLEAIGMGAPQAQMFVIRLVHGAFSLLAIVAGYRLTKLLVGQSRATQVAWVLSLLWFVPFMSVRNLIEVVSAPLLIYAVYVYWREQELGFPSWLKVFWAGALFALAFDIRYQTAFFTIGFCAVLLFQKRWKQLLIMFGGMIVVWFLVHVVLETMIFEYPLFRKPLNYLKYNLANTATFGKQPWYNFVLLTLGILIPPFSIMVVSGIFANWRKWALLMVPTVLFIVLHSIFPNKQERFILPVLPMLIVVGMAGWHYWSEHRSGLKKLEKVSWRIFWGLNLLLLPFVTVHYSKRAQVEAMSYVRTEVADDVILVDNMTQGDILAMPKYYADRQLYIMGMHQNYPLDSVSAELASQPRSDWPQYIFFVSNKNFDERLANMKTLYPNLEKQAEFKSSMIDELLHWLNPRNKNQTIYVYRDMDRVE